MLNLTRLAVLACALAMLASTVRAEDALRVFIRAGVKTHGPGQHDHPRFLEEWTKLLNERGAKCEGAMDFPKPEQLDNTDVLVIYAAEGGTIEPDQRTSLEKFTKRGGGIVVIHDGVCGKDADWFKTIIGGAWQHGKAKWYEGEVGLYFQDTSHPITKGITNFDLKDEVYYGMNMLPEAKILASSFHDVFTIAPQIWVYEKDNYRAFVSIPGHNYTTFNLPHYRAMLMRGIAWAGKRTNVDMLCSKEELASMQWPEGGPLPPEKEKELVVVHPDFDMTLVAADPLINKAMNIDWDPQGRMWVAETPEYPAGRKPPKTTYLERGMNAEVLTEDRPARDRISILEDTNGDGVMDKKTVFADGLELVTSLCFYKDGVIVSQAPDIYWLRDTDGDNKADQKITLYTGLGTGDTHAVINNLRWGLDGWIYATHGYSAGHVTSPDKTKDFGNIGSGVVRFKPDGSMIEQYSSKGGNTWGLDIAWDGEVFYTQPTSNDLLMHVAIPEYVLARGKVDKTPSYKVLINNRSSFPLMKWERQAYVQIDLVGKFTASAGCAIYDGGAWPAEWNYSYFTTEPQINLVHHEMVKLDGVTYSANKVREPEFIAGKHLWFRPIETRIGPDGALYVIDWYNQAITHNDTRGTKHTFRNAAVRPDRDHYYGRIWRVQHKQATKLVVPDLSKAGTPELVKALDNPNLHVRNTARRLLGERGDAATVAELEKLVSNNAANPKARVPALAALADLGKATPDTIKAALKAEDPGVRKFAVATATRTGADVGEALTPMLADADPRVRLMTMIAFSSLPMTKAAAQKMVEGYGELKDGFSQSAVVAASKSNPLAFCEAVLNGANAPGPLANLLGNFTTQLAGSSKPEDVVALLNLIASAPAAKDELKLSVLTTLSRDSKAPVPWTPELEKSLKSLILSDNAQLANAAMPLVARWDSKGALAGEVKGRVSKMMEVLNDAKAPEAQRADVARGLLSLSAVNADIMPAVSKVLAETDSMNLKKEIVGALSATPSADAGKAMIDVYPALPGDLQMIAFSELLKRTDWSMALLDALDSNKIKATLLGPANLHRLRQHADAAVAKRANEAIDKILGPETKEKDALIAKFTPIVSAPGGDAAKGKEVFTKNCATCHKLGDIGREVGPVLNGIGAHGPAALIVAILDPNREVEPSFTNWMVKTKEGEVFDGVLVRENAGTVLLRNAAGEKEIKKEDIKQRRNTGMSLMPNGFEALGGDQLKDLLTFVCGADQKYRFVDLSTAFTADTRKGLYISDSNPDDSFKFKKMGVVIQENIPFNFQDPAKSASGKNVVVLAGGPNGSFSKKQPKKVEAKVGAAAKTLHILGFAAGWGYPAVKEKDPVLKLTVVYSNGETEEFVYKNGVEVGDYLGDPEIPGTKMVKSNIANHSNVRYLAQPLKKQAVIDKIVLESFDNGVAPTTIAITAELVETHK
jgi:putative membrane-bound dehydrogenase-like protein